MMARPSFMELDGLKIPTSLDEAIAELKPDKPISFIVIDEYFNELKRQEKSKYNVAEFIEAAQLSGACTAELVIAVMLYDPKEVLTEEPPESERKISYSDLGVNFFISRPLSLGVLKEKAQEIGKWLKSPPPWTKVLQNAKNLMKAGKNSEAAAVLEPLYQTMQESIPLGLQLAQAWIAMGPEQAPKAKELLSKISQTNPNSTSPKKLLMQAAALCGDIPLAFEVAIKVLDVQALEDNVVKTLGFAKQLLEKDRSFKPYSEITESLKKCLVKATSVKLRAQALAEMAQQAAAIPEAEECEAIIRANFDIGIELKPAALALFRFLNAKRAEPESHLFRKKSEATFLKVLRLALDVDLDTREAIEPFVILNMKHHHGDLADQYLMKIKEKNKLSIEYYRALVALELHEGRFKEASEALQKGKGLGPGDEKLARLSALWREFYDKAQAKA